MAVDPDLELALAEYRMMFTGAAGSGLEGESLTSWQTEYDRVKASGLAATTITSSTMEGGSSAAGVVNFSPKTLLRALLIRRAELDTDFDDQVFAPPEIKTRRRLGITVRM